MAEQEKGPAAVYVAWGTFKNAIEGLAQAIPNRIDKTVYPGLNSAVINQLLTGYKFLGLIDSTGKPTPTLQALAVKDEATRKQQLAALLRHRYADLFALDLVKTTPAELAEKMEKSYSVTGETREKAIRFFLAAVSYLGIEVSSLLKKTVASSSPSTKRKRQGKPKATPQQQANTTTHTPDSNTNSGGSARVITLASGGTLTLSASLNFLALNPTDRKFFSDLIDKLDAYESKVITPGS